MRKIIGFKLGLRLKEIQRRAKKAKLNCGDERELQLSLDRLAKTLKPAVLFETFPHTDVDQSALSPMPGLAYSVIVGTLGSSFVPPADAQAPVADLWPIIVDVALEDAVAFATRLLQDDAEKDACELSPLTPLTDAAAQDAALKKLGASKIGVSFENGLLTPPATLAVSLSWLSKSKAKGKAK